MDFKRNFIYIAVIFIIATSSLLFSQAAGDSTTDPIVGTMRLVPAPGLAGTTQGSPEAEVGHSDDEDQFTHILTKNLWVMETEVSQQMWSVLEALQDTLPTIVFGFPGISNPVENISWYHAVLFANLLSLENGLTRCYYADAAFTVPIDDTNYTIGTVYCNFDADGYRMATEGEWEYFVRAGTGGPFSLDEVNYTSATSSSCTLDDLPALETAAWFCANCVVNGSKAVGTKIANPWNLKDLHGNVSEWCWDWWDDYPVETQTDYRGPGSGATRVIRGGSWSDIPSALRSASRSSFSPDLCSDTIGFRLVRNIVISVTSPQGGEEWQAGTSHNITWDQEGMTGNINIELYKGDMFDSNIGAAPAADGTFSWDIPGAQTPGTDYKVRIYQGEIQAFSPANFNIIDSSYYSVAFVPGNGGTVSGDLDQFAAPGGDCTEVEAVPDTGYYFVEWTGTGGFVTTTENPLTVTNVTGDMTITAHFAIETYTVTFEAGPNGTLTGTTTQTVDHGGSCTAVEAVPDTWYHFVEWTGTGGFVTTADNPLTVNNVTGDMTITASFAIDTYTVTFEAGANGTLTGTTTQTVDHGGSCTEVEAVPDTGYHFVEWTGTDGFVTTTDNPLTVNNVTGDMTITAHFAIETYTVTFEAGPNGTLTGDTTQEVEYGSNCTPVTAVPNASYHFVNWTGTSGFVTTKNNPLTVTDVTSNMTITANFAIDTYEVTFQVETGVTSNGREGGTLSGSVSQTVDHGSSCTPVTAVPYTGFHFVEWTGTGGFVTNTDNPLTVTNVTGDMTITAHFAINTYTVTFEAGPNGIVTGTTPQTVEHGSSCTSVTAVADTNYHFVNWTGSGGFVSTDNPLIVDNVTGDMTITANFSREYNITFQARHNGTLTGSTNQTVIHGSDCTPVEAVPNTGYHFVDWTGSGGFVSTDNPLTVTNVTASMEIIADFAVNSYTVTFTAGSGGVLTGTLSQTVNHGSNCTSVTAVPNESYHFVNWTGTDGFVSTNNPLIVDNVTGDMEITANFAIDTYTVNFVNGTGGTISGTTSQVVAHGSDCTPVTAVPDTGYNFDEWTGTGGFTATNPTVTVTNVTQDMTITANFAVKTYTVIFTAGTGGTLTGTLSQTVNHGSSCTAVTAVPDTGYNFRKWTGTDGFSSTKNPLTVNNVTGDMTIKANFVIKKFKVIFQMELIGGRYGGTLSGLTTQIINYGESCSPVTVYPSTHYNFVNWTGTGGFVTTTSNPLTVTNVTSNMVITAHFAVKSYTITFQAGTGGTLNGFTIQVVPYGSSTTPVTAVPNTGYIFENWTGTGGFSSAYNPLTIQEVTKNMTITANFKQGNPSGQ